MDAVDRKYLERALDLAERGRGHTTPNPTVGAVIVGAEGVLGEGWHEGAGLDHAEVAAIHDALRRAGKSHGGEPRAIDWDDVREVCCGATLYVTLEPCCTQGRTPPCTTALINGGFSRVVAAVGDPSPTVDGQGFARLQEAGIECEVDSGVLSHRAKRQNDGLRKSLARGLPFVTYKYAMTLDGRVASDTGDSRWISCSKSRTLVHRWRAASDAVVVGVGTVRADDPELTAREVECAHQPLRVVVDPGCTLQKNARLVHTVEEGPVLLVCGEDAPAGRRAEVESWGVATTTSPELPDGGLDPKAVCEELARRGVQSILLEGGPRLAGAWWRAGMIDKVTAFVSPRILSGEKAFGALNVKGVTAMEQAVDLQEVGVEVVGTDVLVAGYVEGPF